MCCDGLPYRTSGMKTWFYFYVSGAHKGQSITFSIKNMNRQGKLLNMGLRPVFRVIPGTRNWQKVIGNTSWNKGESGLELHFEHTFNTEEKTYFAFTYPFSYYDICEKNTKIEEKLQNSEYDYIYYHKELLGKSIEQRNVDLITLTSKEGMLDVREELLENCFPEHGDDQSKRPFKFRDKKVVFLTARVHPGETPASFVLNGILDLLTNKNREQGRRLLDNFVFKIIPCLNPDGCSRGYFRLDTKCQNLNRYYINPTPESQPTIFLAKQAIVQQSNYGVLKYYIDLHAHASKVG
jgi:cytosolic carboxypeptidase protein 5